MKRKRFISLLLCMCMVVTLFTGLGVTASADDDVITHTVTNGEYLFKICKAYGLDYYQCKSAIMALNGFNSEAQLNRISVGQVIKLPGSNAVAQTVKSTTTTTTTVSTSTVVNGTTTTTSSTSAVQSNLVGRTVSYYLVPHVVAKGETLNDICNALGTSYYAYASVILGVNGLASPNKLQAGKTIYVPSATAPATGGYAVVAHSVAAGETLTSICSQYGLDYQSNKTLVNGLNSGTNMNKIYAGQTIYVPTKTTAAAAAAVSTGSTGTASTATAATATSGYQVSITAAEHGSPYVVVGNTSYATRAQAGTAVVIKTNPDSGYAVKAIKVVRTDNNANIVVTNNAFTMPESNVQITITYAQGLKITKATSSYGSFDALVFGNVASSAFYGDEVVVSCTPYSGYSVSNVYYVKTENSSISKTVTPDSSGVYKFSMPNYNIKLFVEFKQTTYHKLSAHVIGKGTVTFTVDGKAVTEAKKGATVVATLKPQDKTWVFDDGVTAPKLTDSAVELKKTGELTYSFVVGDNDITLYDVTFVNVAAYKLAVANASTKKGCYITFTVRDPKTGTIRYRTDWAKKGDIVDIVYWPADGFEGVADSSATTDDDTADFTILSPSGVLLTSWTSSTLRGKQFVMPDSDVTVRWPYFKENSTAKYYNIGFDVRGGVKEIYTTTTAPSWSGSSAPVRTGKAQASQAVYVVVSCYPNSSVKLPVTIQPKSGSAVNLTSPETPVTGQPVNVSVYKLSSMPGSDITVIVNIKESLNTVDVSAKGDGGLDNTSRAYEKVVLTLNDQYVDYVDGSGSVVPAKVIVGSKLRLWFNVMPGYQVAQVEKTGGSGTKLILPDSSGAYWYTVTEADFTSGNAVVLSVTTQATVDPEYNIQNGNPDSAGGSYSIEVIDKKTGVGTTYAAGKDAKAHEGDTITLHIYAKTGYQMGQVIKDGYVVSGADIKTISNTEWSYTFIMPAGNVTTQVVFDSIPNVFTISGFDTSCAWKDNPGSGTADEIISMKVMPPAGEIILNASVDGGTVPSTTSSVPDEDGYYTLTFTMPQHSITSISMVHRKPWAKGNTITVPDGWTGTAAWTGSPLAVAVGSVAKVPFSITNVTGLPDVEITSVSGLDEIPYVITYDQTTGKGTIDFTMPGRDIDISAIAEYVEHD